MLLGGIHWDSPGCFAVAAINRPDLGQLGEERAFLAFTAQSSSRREARTGTEADCREEHWKERKDKAAPRYGGEVY